MQDGGFQTALKRLQHPPTRQRVAHEMRESRDSELGMPKLILPSLQVNLRAGHLPPPEDNGTRYLKIPLDVT